MPLQNGERCCRRFHSARNICKRKKCDYDFTHKKCGYFHSHTCVFGQLYCDFYAGLKDKCQLPVGVYNNPVERFEHERIAELVDFSDLVNQKAHLFRTVFTSLRDMRMQAFAIWALLNIQAEELDCLAQSSQSDFTRNRWQCRHNFLY